VTLHRYVGDKIESVDKNCRLFQNEEKSEFLQNVFTSSQNNQNNKSDSFQSLSSSQNNQNNENVSTSSQNKPSEVFEPGSPQPFPKSLIEELMSQE
jgi:hypothetical protein